MNTLARLGLCGAALALAGCESDGAPPLAAAGAAKPSSAVVRACFRSNDVRNHTVADPRTLYLDVLGRGVYRVDMTGPCLAGAVSSDPIVMRNRGMSDICRPIDLEIGISRGTTLTPCMVAGITPLTPAEVAALPPRLRP